MFLLLISFFVSLNHIPVFTVHASIKVLSYVRLPMLIFLVLSNIFSLSQSLQNQPGVLLNCCWCVARELVVRFPVEPSGPINEPKLEIGACPKDPRGGICPKLDIGGCPKDASEGICPKPEFGGCPKDPREGICPKPEFGGCPQDPSEGTCPKLEDWPRKLFDPLSNSCPKSTYGDGLCSPI